MREKTVIVIGFTRDCSRDRSRLSSGCDWLISFHESSWRARSNVKDDAAFVLYPCAPDVRQPLNSTNGDGRRDKQRRRRRWYRYCASVRIVTLDRESFVLFLLEMPCRRLNRQARHLSSHRYYVDITKILRTQASVRECGESEDDEMDNDSRTTASRSDSGTLSSWDAATCAECIAAHWSSEWRVELVDTCHWWISGNIFDIRWIKHFI